MIEKQKTLYQLTDEYGGPVCLIETDAPEEEVTRLWKMVNSSEIPDIEYEVLVNSGVEDGTESEQLCCLLVWGGYDIERQYVVEIKC